MLQTLKTTANSFNGLFSSLASHIKKPCIPRDALKKMTIEEKVGQLLMVHLYAESANQAAQTLIQDVKVGGVIYYNWANGLSSPHQVRSLSTGLQNLAQKNRIPIPLLIAIDQEGGVVARLTQGFTIFPGNKSLGMTGNPRLAKEASRAIGLELKSVGVNMNLAPVVDVNSEPKNPVIGVRSFSKSPKKVIAWGRQALIGYRQSGTIATLKHFPGHGDVKVDSHIALPVNAKSLDQLKQTDLLPFAKLASSADAIMTAHIVTPALDPENCATLSSKTMAYLREKLGFQKVIITDSLVMEGVLKQCKTVDEAAIRSLAAGCDILLLGGKQLTSSQKNLELTADDIQQVHRSIVDAVKIGRVSENRLDQAVQRVLQLKEKYLTPSSDETKIDTANHKALAEKIATSALKIKQTGLIPPLQQQNVFVAAPKILNEAMEKAHFSNLGKTTDSFYFKDLNPTAEEIEMAKNQAKNADALLICSYNAWKNPAQQTLIQSLVDLGKPVILIVTRDPLDSSLFPSANLTINTYSPTAPSIQAAGDYIRKL